MFGLFATVFFHYPVYAEDNSKDAITVGYEDFSITDFKAFIENPNQQIKSDCLFSLSEQDGKSCINWEYGEEQKHKGTSQDQYYIRLGDLVVYSEHIKFACDEGHRLSNFLNSNGVIGECFNKFFIRTSGIPITLFVVVNQKNYFITVDDEESDPHSATDDPKHDDNACVYRFYTQEQYYEKFAQNRKGTMIINGEDYSDESGIITSYGWIFFQFRPVMEKLGFQLIWYEPKQICLLKNEKGVFILDPQGKHGVTLIDQLGNERWCSPFPGERPKFYYKVVDGKTIVSEDMFRIMADRLELDITISSMNGVFSISQTE